MKKLLLATTILTSLSNLTLADSNNNYYFKIQPEVVSTFASFIQENSTTSKTGTTKIDIGFFTTSNGVKLEIGKYLNDYFALSIGSSWTLNAEAETGMNSMAISINSKLIPKLNLIAYKSDDTTVVLGAGIGFHQIRSGYISTVTNEKKSKFIGDDLSGIISEINLNIATNINPTANIGLDLGISYSTLSLTEVRQEAISNTKATQNWQSVGVSIGLSAKFSV